jgi:hypothetical protein
MGRSGTALGIVAAGEGATLVLALVMVGLTMLGQSAPAAVRLGLWGAPVAAAVVGVSLADGVAEAVVYGITPTLFARVRGSGRSAPPGASRRGSVWVTRSWAAGWWTCSVSG